MWQPITKLAALAGLCLAFMLGAVACLPAGVPVSSSSGDYAENAVATVDLPDYASAEPPPPPPAAPPETGSAGPELDRPTPSVRVARASVPRRPAELEPPATDTSGADADNEPFAGLGAFVKPPVWTAGSWYTLQFVAGQNQAALKDVSEDQELTTARGIWMARTMRVTLDPNPNFEVKPQNPNQEIQDLSPELAAAWFWNVKPLKPGSYTLFARVEVLERGADGQLIKGPDGKIKSHAFPPRKVDVKVRVGTQEGVMNAIDNASLFGDAFAGLFRSWEKALVALAALIAAASGAWLAFRKFGKARDRKSGSAPANRPDGVI